MGLRIRALTDDGAVLTDDTTGWAFGPVFEQEDHAEAFVAWLADRHGIEDVRKVVANHLRNLYAEWWDEAVDGESGLLKESVQSGD